MMRSITSYLADILKKERDADQRLGEQPAWYPSSIGGCERAAVLSRAGEPKRDIDAITLRKFWIGSELHQSLQEKLEVAMAEEKGVKFLGHELSVKDDEFHIAGKVDTLVQVDGDIEVWEYKTASSRSFSYSDFPKEDHVLQVGVYLTFPATPKPTKGVHDEQVALFKYPLPKRARLIYLSKDDARVEEFVIDPASATVGDVPIHEAVRSLLTSLEAGFQAYKKDGTLPPPTPLYVDKIVKGKVELKQNWRVTYCDFLGKGKCCGDVESQLNESLGKR